MYIIKVDGKIKVKLKEERESKYMLRISDIKLSLEEDEKVIKDKVAKKLKIKANDIVDYKIYKKSVDARKKNNIHLVYTIDIRVKDEEVILKRNKNIKRVEEELSKYYRIDNLREKRPVIVGTGPAGLFAGLVLAKSGFKPILIERGKKVEERVLDVNKFWKEGILDEESNVQFGEGGAGTFSDGKLTTLIKDPRSKRVLEFFVEAGAPEEILYLNKPHIGTDILRRVVKSIRDIIEDEGGSFKFQAKATDFIIENDKIVGVEINNKDIIYTDRLILAIGHSARDTFQLIYSKKMDIRQKGFSIGVRIEHPQRLIDENQYGDFVDNEKLQSAEYKLSTHLDNGKSLYTFCMCPGGFVVGSTSEKNMLVTNGMSFHSRKGKNSNSAILVNINPEDFGSEHPLAGVEFQREWERKAFELGGGDYKAPCQKVGDFLKGVASQSMGKLEATYRPGVKMTDLRECLPDYVAETLRLGILEFDKKIRGFANPDSLMTGVETRSSSPVRIERNEDYQSNVRGVYPCGEGAGYAGGIMSAAVDGIRIAEKIIEEIG